MRPVWLTMVHYRPISWVLVTALSLAVVMPSHYHLHHLNDNGAAEHDHALDFHIIADGNGHVHHDSDTSIIAATPDVIVNTEKSLLASILPLGLVLLLLLSVAVAVRLRHRHRNVRLVRRFHYYHPPLRAPPPR